MSLTRKTPLRRKKPWHPRRTKLTNSAPIKAVSKKREGQMREYYKVKQEFRLSRRREGRYHCDGCGTGRMLQLHHKRGRVGALLMDARFFSLLCFSCHEWTHAHPAAARERGLLAPSSEWNVVPRE